MMYQSNNRAHRHTDPFLDNVKTTALTAGLLILTILVILILLFSVLGGRAL